MAGKMVHLSIDEFRKDFERYLITQTPVTVMRDGRTVRFFIPKRPMLTDEELASFHKAGEEVRALMAEYGVTEDEVVSEFESLRHGRTKDAGD